jgi:hypothetical protein
MTTAPAVPSSATQFVRGRIIEAQVKVSVDPARPLPLVCALYAVESSHGVWLCAYYGANRSVFDFLPQKGAEVEETKLGITFRSKQFIPKDQYQPEQWEDFKKKKFMAYGGHGE